MRVVRLAGAGLAATALLVASAPASAQFFMQAKDLSGLPVIGDEPGVGQTLPGATPAELTAGVVWNMRAALNVAALQCQFEPTLLAVQNYNAILTDHKEELKNSFDTLTKYFVRMNNKNVKLGQTALDQFGTRTYAGFATVSAQYNFCQTANEIGREAIFAPRGSFAKLALTRMRELRNSLTPWGEQRFPRYLNTQVTMPRLDDICWSKKGDWVAKKCGAQNFPPAGTSVAQR